MTIRTSVLGEPPTPRMLICPVPLVEMPYPITPRRVTKIAGDRSSTASITVRAVVRLMLDEVAVGSLGAVSAVTVTLIVVSTEAGARRIAISWPQEPTDATRVSNPSARTWTCEPAEQGTATRPFASAVRDEVLSPRAETRVTWALRIDAPV